MAFFRQWVWVWLALVLGGGSALAATAREDRAYAAAISAFQDGMWERAETGFARFVAKYPDSDRVAEAVLLQAEAEYRQAKLTDAITLLTLRKGGAGDLADQYVYWIGESQFQAGDLQAAADTFVSLVRDFPESSLRLRAVVEAAAAQAGLGNWPQLSALLEPTNSVFQRAVQMDPASELVARGSLLLAQAKYEQKDYRGATTVLESLNLRTLDPALDWQRTYLLYQAQLAAGDTNAALAATTNLIQIAQSEKDDNRCAEGMVLRAGMLEQLGQITNAMTAYQDVLKLNAPPADRARQAILKLAELAAGENRSADAEQALEKFLAQFPGSPATDVALLTLGEMQLKDYVRQPATTNQLTAAQDHFDRLINTLTNSPLIGKAYLDRGWCLWAAARVPESFDAFRQASRRLGPSEDQALARFKMGDALFAQKDYPGALENYRAVVDDYPRFPAVMQTLGDRAWYQILRANLQLTNYDGASNAMTRILTLYPSSDLAGSSLLLVGEGLADARQPAAARALFQKFVEQSPTNALLPRVELAVARTYEQDESPDWSAAINQYADWLKDFPTNALRPQAEYALAWANFQAGNESNAFQLYTNFVTQYPTNDLAPLAQYWVADHYFRLGGTNYVDAERNYKLLYQNTNWQAFYQNTNWAGASLVYQARMMAGRAAMGLPSYSDAIDHFTSLTSDTNCPANLSAQAWFEYGNALMQRDLTDTNNPLANLQLATNAFSQICQLYPTNQLSALAWNAIGDCDLQMNAYDAATNAYAQALNSPYADVSARSRAQVGIGIVLEKKAALATGPDQTRLLQQALDNYLDVFDTSLGIHLRDGEVADPFWVKKAGLQALPLVESLGTADPGRFFDHLERVLPQLKDSLEKRKAVMLSARH